MARPKDRDPKITIEQSTEGDVRTVMVMVTAPAKDFLLPDLLSGQGAIDSYESMLTEAVKGTTKRYLEGAKAAVAAIAEQKQGQKPIAAAPESKQPEIRKPAKPRPEKAADEVAPAQPSTGLPERVNGSVAV